MDAILGVLADHLGDVPGLPSPQEILDMGDVDELPREGAAPAARGGAQAAVRRQPRARRRPARPLLRHR